MTEEEKAIHSRYEDLASMMNEAEQRRWAAAEARSLGYGGIARVVRATGMSKTRIGRGLSDLDDPEHTAMVAAGRVRRPGAGRPPLTQKDPGLVGALDRLVSPATRGDPESPLRWTSKSTGHLAEALQDEGHEISADTVGSMLKEQGYSLQATRKTLEGGDHPDRDAQFQHIADQTRAMQAAGQPVISVDCKKKELVGDFKNGGREWQPKGHPEAVNVYDFVDDALFKVVPYGIYDVTRNEGWVSVGIDHETAEFAVDSIRQWWRGMGQRRYQDATELYIVADAGGGNSSHSRLWKRELQRLADSTQLTIHVSHMPPGTSKWNKIEHRLFSQITMNWRGRPLRTLAAVISLIGSTRTESGLKVKAVADQKKYRTGLKVTNAEMREIRLEKDNFHGDWNYTITPHAKAAERREQ